MSRWAADGNEKLYALDYLSGRVQKQGFQTGDLSSSPIKPGGSGDQIDLSTRSSGDFDLKAEFLQGRAKVLTKTDFPDRHLKRITNSRLIFYNQFPAHLVGDNENWAFAHPVKDCCLTTFKCSVAILKELIQAGLVTVCWADLPIPRVPVYQWAHFGSKNPNKKPIEVPSLYQDESPA